MCVCVYGKFILEKFGCNGKEEYNKEKYDIIKVQKYHMRKSIGERKKKKG